MPRWVRVWFHLPFIDRYAYAWMWHHGGWDVLPPDEPDTGVREPRAAKPQPPADRIGEFMDERDEPAPATETTAPATEATAKPVPIGLTRLRQHFVEPVRKNAKEIGAAGVVAGLAALLGADDETSPSDGGGGPSPTMRRVQWAALGVIVALVVVVAVGGLLR
jgi:hypothetical protein